MPFHYQRLLGRAAWLGMILWAASSLSLGAGANSGAAISRDLWTFDRSQLMWGEGIDPAVERAAGRLNGIKGWLEYDVEIPSAGWYELWFTGMPSSWGRDVCVDGQPMLRHSIAMPDDRDPSDARGTTFKEANIYLEAGKHSLRISRLDYPSQFPASWALVPGAGRPETTLRVEEIADSIVRPGESFNLKIVGGGGGKAVAYDLFLKSLVTDASPVPVGRVEFPSSSKPMSTALSISPGTDSGAFVLLARHGDQWLRPNDVKSGPLIVSRSAQTRTGQRAIAPTSLSVAGMFAKGMVLQRQAPLPIWGWAPAGTDVKVALAGQTQSIKADAQGRWKVVFKPIEAGGPHRIEISGAGKTLAVDDVLVGDVWLLAGQSNMGGQLGGVPGGREVAASANSPTVRFTVAMTRTATAEDLSTITCGWQAAAPPAKDDREAMLRWNAIAYAFGTDLQKKVNVPVGMIMNSRGGTSITTWASRAAQEAEPAYRYWLDRWDGDGNANYVDARVAAIVVNSIRTAREKQAKDPKAAATQPAINVDEIVAGRYIDQGRSEPGGHYEALVRPLSPFPFKGAVWYQGEADTGLAFVYGAMLKAFVADWRKTLENPDLPFVIVQVAQSSGAPYDGDPIENRYGEMQEAQATILSTPRTSIISTYDLPGPKDDVHYKDKLPVGHRAAAAALHDVYGFDDVVGAGPRYESMTIDGNRVKLTFSSIGGGLVAKGDKLGGFAIAGDDHKFVWAQASIEGDQVIVQSDKVAKPAAVRYGWAPRPCGANLYNKAGLPAPIFRTDRWPTTSAH